MVAATDPFANPALPERMVGLPDLSLVGDVSFGAFARLPVLAVSLLVFILVLANFFDAMGIMTGLGQQAGPRRALSSRCPEGELLDVPIMPA